MSSLTAPEVAYCFLVLVISFAIRGGIGFGAAALPLIALVLPMKLVVPAGYLAVGAYDREALIATAISLPLMFVGVALGNRIHTNLSEIAFRRLLSIVLVSSGVPLMLG